MRTGKKTTEGKSRGKRLRWLSKVSRFLVWAHGCSYDCRHKAIAQIRHSSLIPSEPEKRKTYDFWAWG